MNLNFNTETGDFDGIDICAGNEYKITLLDFTKDDQESATNLANRVSSWVAENLESVKLFAATELVKLKNDEWLEENESEVSNDTFVSIIELNSVLAFSDGSFEVFFDDNDLFWGHAIKVDIDSQFNMNGVNLWG